MKIDILLGILLALSVYFLVKRKIPMTYSFSAIILFAIFIFINHVEIPFYKTIFGQ
ncbi:hypothetical protein QFZ80_000235 [Paenibacillus sp. V4I7]|nr:hypothetical protein [Paenibacillus sp. V4I7]MDQ0914049.1 hypothetical protein [Paenibacillus sp. V4I5]